MRDLCSQGIFVVGVKESRRGLAILKVYLTTNRPVLEYAIPVWQAIPDYLSNKIKSLQKRVLHIVFPYIDSYNSALLSAGLETLGHRRS